MWHFISEQIGQHLQRDFICDDIREVNGGDSNRAFRITDGRRRFFVKVNDKAKVDTFEAEAQGLRQFAHTGLFRVPKVINVGSVGEHAFLVLEHINMSDGDGNGWAEFGKSLAQCHKHQTQDMFGWQEDNFIGPTFQQNRWQKRWSDFFAEQRIGYLLQLLWEQGEHIADIERTVDAITALLKGHQPKASLLHGDLWKGNTGFAKGEAVIFDPAFYFGDRETDIAMSELFQRFPNEFYQGYNQEWPLDDGYEFRKPVYQLYHVLNHALIFGGHYLDSAKHQLVNLDS